MASEYSVNIKLNTQQVKKDLQTIKGEIGKVGQKTNKGSKAALTDSEKQLKHEIAKTRIVNERIAIETKYKKMRSDVDAKEVRELKIQDNLYKSITSAEQGNLDIAKKANLTARQVILDTQKELALEKKVTDEKAKQVSLKRQIASPIGGTRTMMGSPSQLAFAGSGMGRSPLRGTSLQFGSPAFFENAAKIGGARSPLLGTKTTFGSPKFFEASAKAGGPSVPIKGSKDIFGSPAYYDAANKEALRVAKSNAMPIKGFKHLVGSPAYFEDQAKKLKRLRGAPTGFSAAEYGPQQPMQGPRMFGQAFDSTGASSALNFSRSGRLLQGPAGSSANTFGNLMRRFGPTRGFDFGSAAISGGFPLLFGQGPVTAAAGALGGGIGGMFGQMGGFAGGIAATAIVQQIQNTIASVSKLGQAFSTLTPDVEGLTAALGASGTEREKQIQLIKKTEGTQAALAAVTEQLNQQIGEKGVENLKEFGETTRLIGNTFQILGTKMLAALAPVFNLLAKPISEPAKRAERERLAGVGGAATDPTLLALQNDLANVTSSGMGRSAAKAADDKRAEIRALIEARKEELALIGEGLERQQTVNMIEDSRLKKIRQQNALLQAKIDGNYEEVLLAQELDAKIKEMIEDGAKLEELDVNKIENLLKQNKELEKQAEQAEKIRQEFQQLGQSLATDVADGLKGLIKGTSTLGDMINSVLDKMLDAAINMAMFGNLSGTLGGGGGFFGLFGGLFGGKKTTPAPTLPSDYNQRRFGFMRAAGGPVKGGKSYIVGEQGPELFTPGVSGGITPNHALGGTTSVNVNVDASGSSVEGDAGQAEQLGEAISQAIQAELIQQKRPGGILYS